MALKKAEEFIPIRFRTGFNDDGVEAGDRSSIECRDISLTVQEGREDSDINKIMTRYVSTGVAPQVVRVPMEEDFDRIVDFRGAMDAVRAAQESFAGLDAKVRQRFNHDPAVFHDFCVDPSNLPELRKLGLAVPEPSPPAPAPEPKKGGEGGGTT